MTILIEGEPTVAHEEQREHGRTRVSDLSVAVTAKLIWDLERGVASSFILEGEAHLTMTDELEANGVQLVQFVELEGTWTSAAAFEFQE